MTRDQRIRLAMLWLRRSHGAFTAGNRSDEAMAGERLHEAWQQRVRQAKAAT